MRCSRKSRTSRRLVLQLLHNLLPEILGLGWRWRRRGRLGWLEAHATIVPRRDWFGGWLPARGRLPQLTRLRLRHVALLRVAADGDTADDRIQAPVGSGLWFRLGLGLGGGVRLRLGRMSTYMSISVYDMNNKHKYKNTCSCKSTCLYE